MSAILSTMQSWLDEAKAIRHTLHSRPETGFTEVETQKLVMRLLKEYGVDEINRDFAKTGLVAVIYGKQDGKAIGLRADMDALPIQEETELEYASRTAGKMHACGHDGHTTMLLMAAKYLCLNRDFPGKAVLFFQPAEEGLGGARAMIDEGVLDKYPVSAMYALHNMPKMPEASFGFRKGTIMASSDRFYITIKGKGGHAAIPQTTKDPLLVASLIYQGIQGFVARTFNPLDPVVVSVTQMQCGETSNVIANEASMVGTFRTHSEPVRQQVIAQFEQLVPHLALAFGMEAEFRLGKISHPCTENTPSETQQAIDAAKAIVGENQVQENVEPLMASEDFACFLTQVPGCYGFIGNGDSEELHNSRYNFNDNIIPYGAAYFAQILFSQHQ
ncbi:peptidase M20 [Pasteurellaceae bacterium RH1A]|nr:peptidase M20 [Pasteurellaceae bacterium RH1A]